MPEKRFVTTCRECRYFRLFKDETYGSCTRFHFRDIVVRKDDFCSYAELPLPLIDDHNVSGIIDE